MTDAALHGQLKQLRISLEDEVSLEDEAEKTRECLGGKLDGIDGKLDRIIEIAEQVIEDEPWKGEQ